VRLSGSLYACVGGDAEHGEVGAELRLPGTAGVARAAALDRADRDPVTLLQPVGAGDLAEADDLAGELVPEHERPLAGGRADRALAVVVLDIGAAETAGRDLDENLVLGDRRLRHLFDADVLGLIEDCCFHGVLSFQRERTCLSSRASSAMRSLQVSAHESAFIGMASTDHHLLV
jgi:hypothetical protein